MIKEVTPKLNDGIEFPDYNIFLAGTIDDGNSRDWQKYFIDEISKVDTSLDINIFNPRRDDWNPDSTTEDIIEQIKWEDRALSASDLIIFNFLPNSYSPITLLELGERLALGHECVVICNEQYWRHTNVIYITKKYNENVIVFNTEKDALNHIQYAIES